MLTQYAPSAHHAYPKTVVLYERQGIPQQEIAALLGISLCGTKSLVQRSREKRKQMMFAYCSFDLDRQGNIFYQRNRP